MAVRTTTGTGASEVEWHRPQGARATAESRWFREAAGTEDRPSFLELLVPLVALSLGAVFAVAIAAALLFGVLSMVL